MQTTTKMPVIKREKLYFIQRCPSSFGLSSRLDEAAGQMRPNSTASVETNPWLDCMETYFDNEAENYPWLRQVNQSQEKKNQLDATEWLIALIIRSTYFGHFYIHHQELEVCYYRLWCAVLGCWFRGSGAGQQAMRPGRGMLHDCSRATSLFLDA